MSRTFYKYCIVCKKKKFININTFLNIIYRKCLNCNLHTQTNYKLINYKKKIISYIDKFGKKRNFCNQYEIKKKINNWYGDIPGFINSLAKKKKMNVFDFGCGQGLLLSQIKFHHKYCFDKSDANVEFIKKKVQGIKIISKPLSKKYENFFDVIIIYHVIEHIEKPIMLLEKLKKQLKKNGIIIIGTPNIDCFSYRVFRGNFRLFDKEHIFMFGEKSLEFLLKRMNFKILKKEFPFFKTEYFNIKNLFLMLFFWKLSPPFYKNIMTFYCQK